MTSNGKPAISAATITENLMTTLIKTCIADLAMEEHRLACRRQSEAVLYTTPNNENANGSLKQKDDALIECLHCQRMLAASRYASHLSGCMGIGGIGATRRGGESRRTAIVNSNRLARATSYTSEEETSDKKNPYKYVLNGTNKRSSSQPPALDGSKPKKPRPLPVAASTSLSTSHPLAKTHSAPGIARPLSLTSPELEVERRPSPVARQQYQIQEDDRPDSDSSDDEPINVTATTTAVSHENGHTNGNNLGTPSKAGPMKNVRPIHPLARGVGGGDSDSYNSSEASSDSE